MRSAVRTVRELIAFAIRAFTSPAWYARVALKVAVQLTKALATFGQVQVDCVSRALVAQRRAKRAAHGLASKLWVGVSPLVDGRHLFDEEGRGLHLLHAGRLYASLPLQFRWNPFDHGDKPHLDDWARTVGQQRGCW